MFMYIIFGEMFYKVYENIFMEFVRFIFYLMENGINSIEFFWFGKFLEDCGIGSIVVIKIFLFGYFVEYF